MAIYKKGTTQAQKTKSIIIIIVLVVLLSIPIYKIGKKLLSYIPEKKSNNVSSEKKNSKVVSMVLSCIFENVYDAGILMGPSDEYYDIWSEDKLIVLNYNKKTLNGKPSSVWNDHKIVAKSHRNLQQEQNMEGSDFILVTTFTLNRITGKLKQEIAPQWGQYGKTTINFNCSKYKKKF